MGPGLHRGVRVHGRNLRSRLDPQAAKASKTTINRGNQADRKVLRKAEAW